jgi:hypothetical protein
VSHERAEWLKQQLKNFAVKGPLQSRFDHLCKLLPDLSESTEKHKAEGVLDYFLFEWFDENGEPVIEHFLSKNDRLTEADRLVLVDWLDSYNSVFEIKSLGRNSLRLIDLDTSEGFSVKTIRPLDKTPFKRGQCITARLLPFGDKFIFSGFQIILPDRESAIEEVRIRKSLDRLYSPEAMEKAQRQQCDAFCRFFGCDEISVKLSELNSKVCSFQRYLLTEHRDPETRMTAAEAFRAEFGHDPVLPEMELIPELPPAAEEVTILCDEFDGLVLLPDYQKFKRVFATDAPDRAVPKWEEIIWKYIKDPDIPIVAFERVAERHPRRVQRVLRSLLGNKTFSIDHLYALLLHYKQPVEGLDDLEDDERLWDMFDGNERPARRTPRAAKPGKKTATVAAKKLAVRKKTAAAKPAPRAALDSRKPVKKAVARKR